MDKHAGAGSGGDGQSENCGAPFPSRRSVNSSPDVTACVCWTSELAVVERSGHVGTCFFFWGGGVKSVFCLMDLCVSLRLYHRLRQPPDQ